MSCLLLAVPVLVVVARRPATACSVVSNPAHELDAAHAGDTVAPTVVSATAAVSRVSEEEGCGDPHPCGDLAQISVTVDATDDATPFDRLGYQILVVRGDLPVGLHLPDAVVSSASTLGGVLLFHFDGDDRSGFSFDLEIRARDLNGNLGPATTLTISEPGDGGCAASRSSFASWWLVALAICARLRHRRRW